MTDLQPPEGEGYDLQAVYAEDNKPFWFRWADRWWMIPHLKMLDFEVQAEIENFDFSSVTAPEGGDVDVAAARAKLNELFDLIMGEQQGQQWREVPRPIGFLIEMLNKWTTHSGAKPGEAPASESSSASTGRPSKRTSTGSTASGSRKRSAPAKKAAPKKEIKAATPPVSS